MSTPSQKIGSLVVNELTIESIRALRTPAGGFVLVFERGVEVKLTAAELMGQARCLAKLAAAGIILRRLPGDFFETWYRAFVIPVVLACDPPPTRRPTIGDTP